MNKKINSLNRAIGLFFVILLTVVGQVFSQTPSVNITTYQPTTVPQGATFEWHSDLPVSAANLMTPAQAQSAAPGVYYAVYNLGGNPVCYSQPTALKVATNVCPATTVELKASVDSTGKPSGSIVTFHSDPVVTDANRITNTLITTTSTAVVYFVAYRDAAGCYTTSNSAIVAIATNCNVLCLAGSTAPVLSSTTKSNVCPATLVDLSSITASNLPANTTLTWHTGTPATTANKISGITALSAGTYYAAIFDATNDCYSPTTAVLAKVNDCNAPIPPIPPVSTTCDYSSAPATVTLNVANEPSGYKKTYLLIDMANGQIVQVNATAPSFSNVNAGNYFSVAAYYADTLKNAVVGKVLPNVFSTSGCLKYSTPLPIRVCGSCDFTTAPTTISFPAAPSTTGGVTTTYVLINEKSNQIKAISSTASFAAVDTGYYAVVAVYRTKPINFVVGDILYEKVTVLDSCYSTSNSIHYRVCASCAAGTVAPAITPTTANNVCPSTTVNLTTLATTSTKPAGTTLVWSLKKTPTLATDTLTNAVTVSASGKYYALFYDKASNCFSPADSVTVTITVCNCPAGTIAPIITATSLQNSCPATTVSLASLANTGTKPSGTTLVWSTHKVPTSSADTLTSLTVSASGKFYAMYYHKVANCFSPADSVAVQINDCESPIPPLPPVPTACDYNTAPANVTLTVSNEPAGYLKTYLLVDMANGQIVKISPTSPSFTGVNAGNYYVVGAYYADTLKDASVGKRITEVYSTSGCLKYSTPLAFRVCGACDYTTAPVTITFNATPSATAGVTTSYVLIDEKTNKIKAISSTASFAAVDTGYYAIVAVYRTKPINFVVGDVLYSKVTVLDSCYEVSNSVHYRVCSNTNLPPIAVNDIFNTVQDKPVLGSVLTNDRDPEGGPLTVTTTPVTPPSKGTVVLNANGTFVYTPNPGVTGQDVFCYEISDNAGLKSTACVTINIVPATTVENNKPIAADDATETYLNTVVVIKVKANDVDPDPTGTPNGTLGTPTKLTNPTNGTVVLNPDGTFAYTPSTGFIGKDTFTYSICDNGTPSLCDTATVTITVLPTPLAGNKPPVALDDANTTLMNTPVNGTVATNDFDPDNNTPLTFTRVNAPTNGTVVFNADGSYTYTPTTGFVGSDVFTYKICDSGVPVKCDTATVTLTVLPLPVAKLVLRVLLQGALYGTSDGLMRDDLRRLNLLPLKEPYTALNDSLGALSTRFKHLKGGGELTTAAVFNANVGTGNAIVDWVFVELRSKSDSTVVLQTASGLVQRDGDVVSPTDGVSALTFTGLTSTSYFVSVKHRNHLGVMTSKAIPMTTVGTLVDFTVMDSSNVWNRPNILTLNYDGVEMNTTVLPGKKALWAGNAVSDFRLKYDGANTDLTKPLNEILVEFSAASYNFNNGIGYKQGDINMDGKVKYAGANNDIIYIQNNLLLYRLNSGLLYNFNNMFEQIP